LAQVYIIGADFVGASPSALILGDNIYYGHGITDLFAAAIDRSDGATVFAYHVTDPERYGVVDFDSRMRALSIEEKPTRPKSNWAVTGLYFYDAEVVEIARVLKPSHRGELEKRQGFKIACPEEIAFEKGFIDAGQLERLANTLGKSEYGQYLHQRLKRGLNI